MGCNSHKKSFSVIEVTSLISELRKVGYEVLHETVEKSLHDVLGKSDEKRWVINE